MRPMLKAPGSMLLKLRYDGTLSNLAFNFTLRRYNPDNERQSGARGESGADGGRGTNRRVTAWRQAGAYTRSLLSSTCMGALCIG
jgi:hypothetical protein